MTLQNTFKETLLLLVFLAYAKSKVWIVNVHDKMQTNGLFIAVVVY